MHLLFVCTGNLCRSPVAERLMFSSAQRLLGVEADDLRIVSAGVEATGGQRMDPRSADALMRRGGNSGGFRSRRFTAAMAEDADLVLTMTRRQRRTVLESTPRGLRRTFTLLEAADLLKHADVTGLTDVPVRDRARELAARLDAARPRHEASDDDDIADPIGRSAGVHAAVASRIAAAVDALAAVLFVDPGADADPIDTNTEQTAVTKP